jgi:hypothetical protein
MSEQDLDALRQAYEGFAAGDWRAALDLLNPEIEIDVLTDRLGKESVARLLADANQLDADQSRLDAVVHDAYVRRGNARERNRGL